MKDLRRMTPPQAEQLREYALERGLSFEHLRRGLLAGTVLSALWMFPGSYEEALSITDRLIAEHVDPSRPRFVPAHDLPGTSREWDIVAVRDYMTIPGQRGRKPVHVATAVTVVNGIRHTCDYLEIWQDQLAMIVHAGYVLSEVSETNPVTVELSKAEHGVRIVGVIQPDGYCFREVDLKDAVAAKLGDVRPASAVG
jgi:hypothetical protein